MLVDVCIDAVRYSVTWGVIQNAKLSPVVLRTGRNISEDRHAPNGGVSVSGER